MLTTDHAMRSKRLIAVISDLHVGPGNRSSELNPFPPASGADDGFNAAFQQFIKDKKISADMLLVPGDIADHGHPNEYARASDLIQTVATTLGVADKRIIIGLGNHDASWSLSSALPDDATGLSKRLRYAPVLHEPWFRSKVSNKNGSLVDDPFFSIATYSDTLVAIYNSANVDDHNTHPHHGAALEAHLDALSTRLATIEYDENVLRILVTHHHPIIYSDPRQDQPDFSAMVNAERLLQLSRDFKFDLLVHGHKHSPRFGVHNVNGAQPIAILCAGSFSKSLDTSWSGAIANQFHVIEVHGRDRATGQIFGVLKNWASRLNRWDPSNQKFQGITHSCRFGYSAVADNFLLRFESGLAPTLATRGHLKWGEIVEFEPSLQYVHAARCIELLRSIAQKWNCSIYPGDTEDELEDIVLLK